MSTLYAEKLQTLYEADFGERPNAILRNAAIILAAVGAWLATGWTWVLPWLLIYYALFAAYMAFVHINVSRASVSRRAVVAAYGLYALHMSVLLAFPAYAIGRDDPIIVLCAALALAGVGLYMLQRPQVSQLLIQIDGLLMCGTGIMGLSQLLPLFSSVLQQIVAVFAVVSAVIYFVATLVAVRRRAMAQRNSEMRVAQTQKTRAMSQFVGGVAHDFNNQLTAVLGHLELASLLEDGEERRRALEQSREAAERAAMTVRQLLATSGRARLAPGEIDLGDSLLKLRELLPALLDSGILVDIRMPPDPCTVHADPVMLETSLVELCLNAQDALPNGGSIHISVGTAQSLPGTVLPPSSNGPFAVITVVDSGPGVPPEALPMLTEPFYTTKPIGEGPGLGLSAVAGFSQQSGGGLRVDSPPGNGLRVQLFLPQRPQGQTPTDSSE